MCSHYCFEESSPKAFLTQYDDSAKYMVEGKLERCFNYSYISINKLTTHSIRFLNIHYVNSNVKKLMKTRI